MSKQTEELARMLWQKAAASDHSVGRLSAFVSLWLISVFVQFVLFVVPKN